MSLNITIRIVGMLLFAAAGLALGLYILSLFPSDTQSSFSDLALYLTLFGALLGLVVFPFITVYPLRALRKRVRQTPSLDLLSATVGLFVGLLLGALFSWPLSLLPGWVGQVAPTVATVVLAGLGVYTAVLRKRDVIETFRAGRASVPIFPTGMDKIPRFEDVGLATNNLQLDNNHNPQTVEGRIQLDKYLLADTSAIIDGRIADIGQTGFLDGTLLVPRFVLNELQHIADSADPTRRARGRRGLDVLNRLQKESIVPVQISEVDAEDIAEVDGKLVKIARIYHCPVITTDFNLNRVAEIQGVKVLNVNELANAVKPVVLPGEEMNVHVIQEGKELGQGVAYLDDGTMVVVENGKRHMNADVEVIVTRVLQTVAGRMIFAQMKNGRTSG